MNNQRVNRAFQKSREVFKIRPPVPFNSSNTLSGVAFVTRTNSVELPGVIVAANSFMKSSLIPTSVSAPEIAPVAAPTAPATTWRRPDRGPPR